MAHKIDKQTIDRILDATNIVDVVSDFVSLKKRGSSYLGLCPFHNERTPSFSVSASRGIFKCFSCGKAGNAVSFLMDLESMSYVEAIKWLGHKYNIEVEERELTSAEKESEAARESMFAANEFALKHFESTLRDTSDGREIGLAYFRERGISDATIAKFHLGYALEKSDDLLSKAIHAGFQEKYLVDTGLAIRTDSGRMYDRFKGRVIYPVHSLSGRVVAFGGRTLRKEKTVAKYVNSPESLIYSKSRELYGMYQARNAIARKKTCILVEGYMDVLSMHQSGVENVVASSGTSLTEGQIRMIKRFADTVILVYDSDPAGVKASLRGIDMLLAAGLSLKVVLLPEGDDPDSFSQSHSASEVEEYIETHKQDLIGFKADVLLKEAGTDLRARSEAINSILQSIALIPDMVERSIYIEECSRKVDVPSDTLAAQLKLFVARKMETDYNKRMAEKARATLEAQPLPQSFQPQPSTADQSTPASGTVPAAQAPAKKIPRSIYLAEKEVITHVLRYGMMYLFDAFLGESDTPMPLNVVTYIENEFKIDNTDFTYEPFRHLWHATLELQATDWEMDCAIFTQGVEAERERQLREGREQIAAAGGDTETVLKLEQALEERIDNELNAKKDQFASNYIREHLMRTDDRSQINLIASLTSDTIVLSKMFPKVDVHEEIVAKIPLAVSTLRGAIVREQIKELHNQLAHDMPREECERLMARILELKATSMDLDKNNGEIVIIP